MAAIFLRTPLGLGKRKSAENQGIFSHRLLDLKGGSGVTRPSIGKGVKEELEAMSAEFWSDALLYRLLDVQAVLPFVGAHSRGMPDLNGCGKGEHFPACEIFHK